MADAVDVVDAVFRRTLIHILHAVADDLQLQIADLKFEDLHVSGRRPRNAAD